MRPQIREQLANLCYAGILAVVGATALAISAANEPDPDSLSDSSAVSDIAGVIGGLLLLSAVLYLIYGLWRLAEILRQPDDESSDH